MSNTSVTVKTHGVKKMNANAQPSTDGWTEVFTKNQLKAIKRELNRQSLRHNLRAKRQQGSRNYRKQTKTHFDNERVEQLALRPRKSCIKSLAKSDQPKKRVRFNLPREDSMPSVANNQPLQGKWVNSPVKLFTASSNMQPTRQENINHFPALPSVSTPANSPRKESDSSLWADLVEQDE